MAKIIDMTGLKYVPEGYQRRILWDGYKIHTATMKDAVAADYDRCFLGGALPNPLQYQMFLQKREALKTIVALEDLVEQYALTNVQLPMVEDQIRELREKYDLYESKEEETHQSAG